MGNGRRTKILLLLWLVIALTGVGAAGYSDGDDGIGSGYDTGGNAGAGVSDARPSGFSPSPSAGRRGGSSFGCTPSPGEPTPVPIPTPTLDRFHYLTPQPPYQQAPAPTIDLDRFLTPNPGSPQIPATLPLPSLVMPTPVMPTIDFSTPPTPLPTR